MKALPKPIAPPIPNAVLFQLGQQLDFREQQLPAELGNEILDANPEAAEAIRQRYLQEREHIRYAREFLDRIRSPR